MRQFKQENAICWWVPNKGTYHHNVFETIRILEKQHEARLKEFSIYAQQYGYGHISGLMPYTYKDTKLLPLRKLHYNVIRNVIDTANSMISRDKPLVKVMTDDANALQQVQAKKLSKFLYGIFDQNGVYDSSVQVQRDASLVGTGAMQVAWASDGNLKIERVWIGEFLYDFVDAYHGSPRSLHRRKPISRHVAAAMFKSHAKDIMEAPQYGEGMNKGAKPWDTVSDIIEITESWHLPSGPNSNDGKHVICVANKTLLVEEWTYDFFPVAFCYWGLPIYGLEGDGLAALLAGIHLALNTHLQNQEEAIALVSSPRVYLDSASGLTEEDINNSHGSVLIGNFAGSSPPIFQTPAALSPDWIQHTQFLLQSAFQIAGVSMMTATGTKPQGLNSGAAIREAQDVETVRFYVAQSNYQKFFVGLAKIVLKMCSKEWSSDIPVKVKGREFLEYINFKDIDLDESSYELSVMPSSLLPKTPAGRKDALREMMELQWISKEDAMRMAEIPDIDHLASLGSAASENIEMAIHKMLFDEPKGLPAELQKAIKNKSDEDKWEILGDYIYVGPEPMQNLQLGIQRCIAYWNKYEYRNVPKARLELLLRWISDAQEMLSMAAGAAQAQAAGMMPSSEPIASPQVAPTQVPGMPGLPPQGM